MPRITYFHGYYNLINLFILHVAYEFEEIIYLPNDFLEICAVNNMFSWQPLITKLSILYSKIRNTRFLIFNFNTKIRLLLKSSFYDTSLTQSQESYPVLFLQAKIKHLQTIPL